ncbi:retrovirus-related pol polyprotein from transposon TNT 1-94 [Tanacetum coccineum]
MSRTMLNEQSLPQKFWCNAVDTSTYILNRILIRAILGKTPYELLREPKNVNEALGDESWIVAMQEELNQFIANDVWELVPQPRNMTIIGTKWVFRNKLDENGIVSRNKARLVAQGYNQQEGIDYDETYAPVARLESIRILLAYACALDFKLFQMDVKSAFLNGFINEEGGVRLVDLSLWLEVYRVGLVGSCVVYLVAGGGECNLFGGGGVRVVKGVWVGEFGVLIVGQRCNSGLVSGGVLWELALVNVRWFCAVAGGEGGFVGLWGVGWEGGIVVQGGGCRGGLEGGALCGRVVLLWSDWVWAEYVRVKVSGVCGVVGFAGRGGWSWVVGRWCAGRCLCVGGRIGEDDGWRWGFECGGLSVRFGGARVVGGGVWEVGVGVLCELKVCGAAVGRSGAVVCGGGGRVVGVCCDCGLGVGMIWFGLVVVWGGKGAVWGGVWGSVSYCRLGVVIGSVRRMLRVVVCWVVGGGVGVHCGRGGGGGPGLLGRLQGGAGGVGVLCDKVACQCLRWGGSSLFCVPAAAGVGRGCLWGDEGWWWGVVVGWVVVAVGSWCGWSVGGGEADMCCGCGAYMGRTNLWGVGMWFSMGGGGYSVFRPLIAVV